MSVQRIERGDLWKHNARFLQLRLRERFRVAVDRHRLRHRHAALLADSFLSSTVQRWLRRFREFRRDSLPSPSSFYRKRVSKDLSGEADSAIFRMLQAVAVPILGNVCHVFMNGLNRVQVYGLEKLHDALLHRPKNSSLLTVSNHVAAMDDPLLVASLLPRRVLLDAQNLRWTLCATDRCFRNPATSAFFRSVKVLPVSRGEGIYQKGMDLAISKLNTGGWVHIFPEGSRSRDGGKTMGSSKRGVGRLVLDADNTPVVLPFVHIGMQEIMPIGANFPRIGKMVTVVIGDPIQFDDLLDAEGTKDLSSGKLYDAVAARIGSRLQELKVEVEKLALEHSTQLQNTAGAAAMRAAVILHQVDWDAFGLTGTVPLADDHIEHEAKDEVSLNVEASSVQHLRMGLSNEDQISPKLHRSVDQTSLMGFAARGLFIMNQSQDEHQGIQTTITPLRAWRQFLESNLCPQLSFCKLSADSCRVFI